MLTIHEHKGSLEHLRVAFVGDGNNIASSLALACASVGADFVIAAPQDYQVPTIAWQEARRRAAAGESLLEWVESPQEAVRDADVVYTDVWVSMGQEAEAEDRRRVFATYQVNEDLMKLAKPDASFMHDMPAHRGEEISENMLDDPSSIVFHQAENRLHAQKAILSELVPG
jgi:ornithine carbamoyltransferase